MEDKILNSILNKYGKDFDEYNFERFLKDNDIDFMNKLEIIYFLYDELKIEGKSLYSYFPNFDREVNAMSNQLNDRSTRTDPYNGERLWWLIDCEGKDERGPLYLHYYQTDSYYEVEKLEEKYAWYGSGDDWYICRKDRWDINRFKHDMDITIAEYN